MRVSHRDKPLPLATNSHLQLFETLVRLLKTAFITKDWNHVCAICMSYLLYDMEKHNCKWALYATIALCIKVFKNSSWTYPRPGCFYRQLSTIQVNNRKKNAMFPSYSSHSSPRRRTQWLHPARVRTAAPTTAAAVTVALLVGTSSAKPTSTSEACPPQPQTMTWSSSVSREYRTSSLHYLILITVPIDFPWPRLSFLWHFC